MREHGFCLIEALIAATIVVVGLVSLVQLFVLASAANQRARARTLATLLAESKLEELAASLEAVASGADYSDARGNTIGEGSDPPTGAVYVRRWSAAPMATQTDLSILDVQVTFPGVSPGEVVRLAGLTITRKP